MMRNAVVDKLVTVMTKMGDDGDNGGADNGDGGDDGWWVPLQAKQQIDYALIKCRTRNAVRGRFFFW